MECGGKPGPRQRAGAQGLITHTDRTPSYSLQVASIGTQGAQALGEALAVNRTLEILE